MELGLESTVATEEGDCRHENLVQSNNEGVHYCENGKSRSGNGVVSQMVGK